MLRLVCRRASVVGTTRAQLLALAPSAVVCGELWSSAWRPTSGVAATFTSPLLLPVRHAATAATGAGSGSASGGSSEGKGSPAGSAAAKDSRGTHGHGSGSNSGGVTQPGVKPKKKTTKIVKKLVRKSRPGGTTTAAGGGGSGGSHSSSGGSASSAAAAATAAAATSTALSGHGSGSSAHRGAASRAKKKTAQKLLKKKKWPSSGSGAGAVSAASSSGGGGVTSSSGAAVAGGGASVVGRRKRKKLGKKLSPATRRHPAKDGGSTSKRAGPRTGAAARAGGPRSGKVGRNARTRNGAAAAASGEGAVSRRRRGKKLRVCVLNSSYDGADSATAAVDNFLCTPEHYTKKDKKRYTFDDVAIKKIDSYRTVRELVTSNKYDIFFNLCDGGRDEKRAGVDVVQALEEMNAAFTGTDSRSFEPSKIDMKLLVGSCGVRVPNFVLLESAESLAKKCRHLRFPVIVKHLSGYASVGINKDNRCDDLDQLKKKVPAFIKEYNHALVEEFIRGREGTVLACADASSPHGVKVFRPLMFNFLKDGDDFAYFEKKWGMNCDENAYGFLPNTDPAYANIVEMARNAYKYIMNGVGYGRVDFRLDDRTGDAFFLEINPNCGMWYSEKDGGDFADIMVQGDPTWNHERFLANAVTRALREQAARKPWYFISHDKSGQFSTRASRTVPAGKCLFGDAVHPIPVVSKALHKLGAEEPSVGAVICRGDGIHQAVAIRHSCEPNMHFVHGRTLLFAARRQINVGEELTVDYATLRDEGMPTFACSCGTQNCRSVIFAMPATARTLEVTAAKKWLREKKRLWLKERVAEREAERLLKKRTAAAASNSHGGSGGSGSAHGSGGGGSGGANASSGSTTASSANSSSGGSSGSHK